MSKKQLPEGIKTAIEILKVVVPNLIKFIKSSEWTGRFRKKTDERLSQLETQVQQQNAAIEQLNEIVSQLVKENYSESTTYTEGDAD